jgi:hypothetical protein
MDRPCMISSLHWVDSGKTRQAICVYVGCVILSYACLCVFWTHVVRVLCNAGSRNGHQVTMRVIQELVQGEQSLSVV